MKKKHIGKLAACLLALTLLFGLLPTTTLAAAGEKIVVKGGLPSSNRGDGAQGGMIIVGSFFAGGGGGGGASDAVKPKRGGDGGHANLAAATPGAGGTYATGADGNDEGGEQGDAASTNNAPFVPGGKTDLTEGSVGGTILNESDGNNIFTYTVAGGNGGSRSPDRWPAGGGAELTLNGAGPHVYDEILVEEGAANASGVGGHAIFNCPGSLTAKKLTAKMSDKTSSTIKIGTLEVTQDMTIDVINPDAFRFEIDTVHIASGATLTILNDQGELRILHLLIENGGAWSATNPAFVKAFDIRYPGNTGHAFNTVDFSGSSTPAYTQDTLIDSATGISVSGQMANGAKLAVRPRVLHAEGKCPACDEIRARMAAGELIVLYDISVTGGYTGELEVSIPVGEQYNGQTVTILHCKNGVMESVPCVVNNGVAEGTFKKLSPFAVVGSRIGVPENTVVDPPKTGDASGGMTGIALVLCALGLGVVVRRRRSINN